MNLEDYANAITKAYVSIGNIHASDTQTVQRILLNGFWWPTLDEDVVCFVQNCPKCQTKYPTAFATLYSITPTPRWSSHIVESLTKGHSNPKPTHRQHLIETEVANYALIKDQLYH